MTRHLFWVAIAAAFALPVIAPHQRAFAQEQQESAEADASADANADASADESAAPSEQSADAQADANADASTQADEQSNAATQADSQSTDSQSAPANDAQNASDRQDAQSNNQGAANNQSPQGGQTTLPPPPDGQDANQAQGREQSRLIEGQERGPQAAPTDRGRTDARDQGRGNFNDGQGRSDDRRGRDRRDDLRVGISFGAATNRGLTINTVEQNSFFFRSGFRQGDVIVSVHGRPVRSDADFVRFLVLEPGQRVPVIILRDGRRQTIYVQYEDVAYRERSDRRPIQASAAYLGVVFDPQARDAAVVRSVNPGSPAQEAGLQSGDIILALNGQEVRSYPEVITLVRQMRPGDELAIVIERARAENEVVAILDAAPNVRTATRPPGVDDGSQDGRLLDRERSIDGNRRGILPRLRN
jgi:hypothetical protein